MRGVPPEMTRAERAVSFQHKRLPQRAAVVVAGPAANFIFAIVLLAVHVRDGRPALHAARRRQGRARQSPPPRAGLEPGDVFVAIDGSPVETFEEFRTSSASTSGPMTLR